MSNSNLQIQPVEGRLPIRALLIEDSPSDADMILDAVNDVEAVPVDIKWISRLNDGIEYLADKPVDVILLDLSLPDSHGLDCVTKARRMAPGTPIVILTGRDDSSLALAALKKGAQDYLVKQTFDGPVIVKSMLYAIERQRVEEISALNLKAENENVKQILDQTPVGIARLNRELMLVDNNESFVNCLSGKVRLGSTLLESWPGFPGNVLDRVLADGVEARIIELVNSLPNGIVDESASSYFDITVLPTRDLEGSIDGLVLIVDDVSERVQLVRQRESFLAALAHDMNVPLLGNDRVLGALVEEKLGPLDAAVRDALQVVRRSNQHLLLMVQNLYFVYTEQAGEESLALNPHNLKKLIIECVEELQPFVDENDLTVAIEIAEDLMVPIDRIGMRRVFLNLLHNACRFARDKSVNIRASKTEGSVAITVSDTGIGIAADRLPGLFKKGWSPDGKSQYTGSAGFGLYVCRKIINAHGGEISCSSNYGDGTVFSISLPI